MFWLVKVLKLRCMHFINTDKLKAWRLKTNVLSMLVRFCSVSMHSNQLHCQIFLFSNILKTLIHCEHCLRRNMYLLWFKLWESRLHFLVSNYCYNKKKILYIWFVWCFILNLWWREYVQNQLKKKNKHLLYRCIHHGHHLFSLWCLNL